MNFMAFTGQVSTHACFPPAPPCSSQNGVCVHRSHFWAYFVSKFHCILAGMKGHTWTQRMQPIHFQSQYKLVKSNHTALIEAVNDELYETQQNKNDISSQVTKLKEYLLSIINGYSPDTTDIVDQELPEQALADDADADEELQQIRQQEEAVKQKVSLLSSSTKPGVWYEIYNGEDRAIRRLKLSVILEDSAQLIFVNRKGIKVMEKDAEVFAQELEDDRSRILADHSTFDHALGKVISSLAA